MRINVNIEVHEDMVALVSQQADAIKQTVRPAMVEEAEKARAASMEIVPVDQGILRASALQVGTNVTETDEEIEVMIGYGGAASSYALLQHETPPSVFSHAPGQSWKYLEIPFNAAAPQIREALVAAVTRALQGAAGTGETFE